MKKYIYEKNYAKKFELNYYNKKDNDRNSRSVNEKLKRYGQHLPL